VIRMDLHMLVLLGARERTEAQYRRLLAETGFQVERVVPTRSPAGLSVIEATPAPQPEGSTDRNVGTTCSTTGARSTARSPTR
jgi:hypothetical protein